MKITPKILIISELLLMLAILALLVPVLNQMHIQVVEDLQNRISAIAVTAALEIDGDLHKQIQGEKDTETQAFVKLKSQLESVRKANNLPPEHIYTFREDPLDPTQMQFIVMTHASPFTGDRYPKQPGMSAVLREGEVHVTGLYEDEHGTWISAYAPIRDTKGEIVGLLEVDEHSMAYFSRLKRVTIYAIGFAFVVLLLTSLLGWYRIHQLILKPLHLINQGVLALARQDFNHRVELNTKDEFETLAHAINDVSTQLDLARVIQRTLQPEKFPKIEGCELASLSRPCDAAGGDYVDIIPLHGNRLMVVMADVSGHGIASSLIMATCRSALRILASSDIEPAELIARLEQHLVDDLKPSRFITLFVGIIHPDQRLVWANAAHAPALIFRQGEIEHLPADRTPIGVEWPEKSTQYETVLGPDDLLIVASDGLIEAIDENDEMFGMSQLEALLKSTYLQSKGSSLGPQDYLNAIAEANSNHTGNLPADDDLTILCLKPQLHENYKSTESSSSDESGGATSARTTSVV